MEYELVDGQKLFKIKNFDSIQPFLMSISSSDDHWMFVSSTGCLTAGRNSPSNNLFPYVTDDLLHVNAHTTGPVSSIWVEKENGTRVLWTPFSNQNIFSLELNLYKGALGNCLVFEENNITLGLKFQYQWNNSEKFGFVKKAKLFNEKDLVKSINLVDGLQNIMPPGIELRTHQEMSNLSNAYKYSELLDDSNMALYSMASLLMDRPEPGEALRANIIYSLTGEDYSISISSLDIKRFNKTRSFKSTRLVTGSPGGYFINIKRDILPNESINWEIVADVNMSQSDIINTLDIVSSNSDINSSINKNILKGISELENHIGNSDGLQKTGIEINDMHHTANVLFNVMRGGIFYKNYMVKKQDFLEFLKLRNIPIYKEFLFQIEKLDDEFLFIKLLDISSKTNSSSFKRLTYEYLPLTFGRRHGDPSRPWNQFDIKVKDSLGKQLFYYAGNWRDIFQNWEGLGISYPLFWESMIAKFFNACSIDGYNPYRITTEGIDWEVLDENDPWSFIGYWSDHQIIYLQKLLENIQKHDKKRLQNMLSEKTYSYSNIPYEIKPYHKIIDTPKQTIEFNQTKEKQICRLVSKIGTDGKLLFQNKKLYHVNMLEKLLTLLLAKVSNFIPSGGIWMNTQRPEWNDANNALVGNGLSMVTVYYLRRFIEFFNELIINNTLSINISTEVYDWFLGTNEALLYHKKIIESKNFDKKMAKSFIDSVGIAASEYRLKVYAYGFTGTSDLNPKKVIGFLSILKEYVDHTIKNNENDSLFHAYNILQINKKDLDISNLYQMLEGQVAVLSSRYLEKKQVINLLDNLFKSKIYRRDQNSFMLYPVKEIKPFLKKNILDKKKIESNELIIEMIKNGDERIVNRDIKGDYHFEAGLINSFELEKKLDNILNEFQYNNTNKKNKNLVLEIYEDTFKHSLFTGRSGGMFAYEGIGSIYWHMVSKLLLAVQEIYFEKTRDEDKSINKKIGLLYYKIREGLSAAKTAEEYGAFPYDPYSHTPANSGAQQPGMTGQVKEELLTRMGELGCIVSDGKILFKPTLLKRSEFLKNKDMFTYYDVNGFKRKIKLKAGQLSFTFCQVPIIYELTNKKSSINITFADNKEFSIESNAINKNYSGFIFSRSGTIKKIHYFIRKDILFENNK